MGGEGIRMDIQRVCVAVEAEMCMCALVHWQNAVTQGAHLRCRRRKSIHGIAQPAESHDLPLLETRVGDRTNSKATSIDRVLAGFGLVQVALCFEIMLPEISFPQALYHQAISGADRPRMICVCMPCLQIQGMITPVPRE